MHSKTESKQRVGSAEIVSRQSPARRLFLTCLILLAQTFSQGAWSQTPQSSHPKLVVLLIADQFPFNYLTRFRDKFTPAGLLRLMDNGAYFTDCRFQQATNQTACGQSVIATGAHPWATGIVADNWYDRKHGKLISATAAPDGAQNTTGSSRQLVGTTIGDELKLCSNGRSKVFTVAVKDSDAQLLAGKLADSAFWIDSRSGSFVGSSQYEFDSASTNKALSGQSWNSAGPLDIGNQRTNQAVADFAKGLIAQEKLGQDNDTDFLGLNFSATETITRRYSPYSPECEELIGKLDETIGNLLQYLDQKVGINNCVIVFTADHGVAPVPEALREKGGDAGRIDPKSFKIQLNNALCTRLGKDEWIEEFEPPNLYLNLNTIDRQQRRQPDVEALTAKLAHSIVGTGEIYSAFQFFLNQVPNGPLTEAVRKSYFWGRSGELFIVPKPGYVFTSEIAGTAAASPYTYDSHVPLFILGNSIKAARYSEPVSPVDIAPTITNILGISPPPMCEGRVLYEILGQSYGGTRARASTTLDRYLMSK